MATAKKAAMKRPAAKKSAKRPAAKKSAQKVAAKKAAKKVAAPGNWAYDGAEKLSPRPKRR